jgi:GT2 family glycosyltransferase
MKIAVLMACHNRREKTLACVAALEANAPLGERRVRVFLVDDGSSDGTGAAVTAAHPDVEVIRGDGNLFWNGAMRVAFEKAVGGDFDAFLWLNDDTLLYPDALARLCALAESHRSQTGRDAVIVGSTQDATTGEPTYGGVVRVAPWRPMSFRLVVPSPGTPGECDSMWGNCVLIPAAIARQVGNLDARFTHSMGDLDYGLRVRRAGYAILAMPGYAGTCSVNTVSGTYLDTSRPLRERLRKMMHHKGLPPGQWGTLTRRHAGPLWFVYWLWPYARVIATSLGFRTAR